MSERTIVVQQAPGTSGLAIAGLIFSILGWLTFGLLCIPGVFLCGLALFSRGPKSAAVAGIIVGFPGVIFFIFVGLGSLLLFVGFGAAVDAVAEAERIRAEQQAPVVAERPIDLFEDDSIQADANAPKPTNDESPNQEQTDLPLADESSTKSNELPNLPNAAVAASRPDETEASANEGKPVPEDDVKQTSEDDADRNEKTAASKLKLAKILIGKNNDSAKERLESIIQDYPDTKAAAEARELLEDF